MLSGKCSTQIGMGSQSGLIEQVQRILFGKELELAACAWSEDGRFLVTAHAGAMGDLFVHQVVIMLYSSLISMHVT